MRSSPAFFNIGAIFGPAEEHSRTDALSSKCFRYAWLSDVIAELIFKLAELVLAVNNGYCTGQLVILNIVSLIALRF
jgi:hypothetical protein